MRFKVGLWGNVVLGLIGGMGLLLYGMYIMSEGLQKIAGPGLRKTLSKLTHNRISGLIIGALVTILFQSSTATTVIMVSLVSASIISLRQTLGVILGADIGTTVTAQLIALKVTEIALPIVGIGATVVFFAKRDRYRRVGQVILGFGLLFLGLKIMAESMGPLRELPFFQELLLQSAGQPLLAIVCSAIFTFLVHSSAATVGIIMVLAMQHMINLHSAVYLLFGANIGTCFTAVLSSLGSSREAQRVATAHLLFKVVGVLIFLPFVDLFAELLTFLASSPGYQVANAHTLFNVSIALMFLPFTGFFAVLLKKIVPDKKISGPPPVIRYLDQKLISTPNIALGLAAKEVEHIIDRVFNMSADIINVFERNDVRMIEKLNEEENIVDLLCRVTSEYLAAILRQPLSREEFNRCMSLMHIVNDLEHIGDIIAKDISYLAKAKITGNLMFSDEGWDEIYIMHHRVVELMRMTKAAYSSTDIDLAGYVLKLYPEIVKMERYLRELHIDRLRQGTARSLKTSSLHLDLINSFLRMSEHIRNICAEIVNFGAGLAQSGAEMDEDDIDINGIEKNNILSLEPFV